MAGATRVVHTATLHKPHVGSHSRQAFIDTNVTGTLNVLTEAREANVKGVVFTSSTSTFGRALTPAKGAPAAWITEDIQPQVRNIYGATKIAAEDLCELAYRNDRLPVIVLRTSRFFPEADDRDDVRKTYPDANLKVNEFLYRRLDIEDAVTAHLLAAEAASDIGFGRYIISATTPFTHDDLAELATDAPAVVARRFPDQPEAYDQLGWRMFPTIERVYVNERARADLGWTPGYDFRSMLDRSLAGEQPRSPLAQTIGAKGYHPFPTGPYTT
jgi:UDP-glucose 4-epimerase